MTQKKKRPSEGKRNSKTKREREMGAEGSRMCGGPSDEEVAEYNRTRKNLETSRSRVDMLEKDLVEKEKERLSLVEQYDHLKSGGWEV